MVSVELYARRALSSLNSTGGKGGHAAYLRKLGFPNLVLARKARSKGQVRKGKVSYLSARVQRS